MAAEFVISIGAKISELLVEPLLIRPLRPIFCFRSIIDDFRRAKTRLSDVQETVRNEVQRARNNALVIHNSVTRWLEDVDAVMPDAQRLENQLDQNRCTWCPSWTCHGRFSKQVLKITVTLKRLCEVGSFGSVAHPAPLHQQIVGSSSSPCFVHSQSSKSAFDQIMEALKRDDVNLIGLYGKAGAGKTTLAQHVQEEAKNLFDRVIMVSVSQCPQVRSIQGFIADFLNLPLQLESDQGRAAKLQQRLKNGEKILLIFDDVQKEFDLGTIGIPSVGCKTLLIARAENPVRTQKDIHLGALTEEEAWTLFESIVVVDDDVRMNSVAKEALAECNCLPKAVVAMGTALNGKSIPEWEETLQELDATKSKIIASLKEDAKKLRLRQDRVHIKIMAAKKNGHEIYQDVEKWLKDVERVLNDVEHVENELKLNRWCFDERDVGKRVEKLMTSVMDLYTDGNFEQVSHPTPLVEDMGLLTYEDLIIFSKAAKSALGQTMEALEIDGVSMIGLYGMGGIGKTTLASVVQKEVVRRKMVDHAVMVTVSQKPDVGSMQNKIAEVLGLDELKQIETLDGRRIKLSQRLKNEKILIILDDVWKWFDLRSIGMTLTECKGCKILLTTRRRDVCASMDCQSEIQLNLLSEDDSQIFFKRKAGLSSEFKFDDVAKQIVEECKCLPIALETVGAALKKKGKDEWTEALEKLRNARLVDIIGVDDDDERNAYRCLRVSYDYLKGCTQAQHAQFILLLCSLFPEDYKIEVEDLTRYIFGMKLFDRVKSIEDARRKVRVTVRFLKDSCLLLDVEGEEYVKIHDVVRDVMLWIGAAESQERNVLTVRDDIDWKDLIKKKSFQNCRAVSFMGDVVPKVSKYSNLQCPNLEIVLIFCKGEYECKEGFFKHTKFLKVLDFRGDGSRKWYKFEIPRSLHTLEYLSTLLLRDLHCFNCSILKELRRLKILSLDDCIIDGEAEAVLGLKKLRFLDLSAWGKRIGMFSFNVIETFTKLEELHGYRFAGSEDGEGTNSSLSEWKLPSNLVALSAEIEHARCLPTGFCFPNLLNYHICVDSSNNSGLRKESTRQHRRLELTRYSLSESSLINMCKKLLPTVQILCLEYFHDLCSVSALNSQAEGALQELEKLKVRKCRKMESVFEFEMDQDASKNINCTVQLKLRALDLETLLELKQVWKGPTRSISLCNLTEMDIHGCPKLTHVFSSALLATSLQKLEFIRIRYCCDLEEFISTRGDSDDDDISCWCCCFTNLSLLEVSNCEKLKTIFPIRKCSSGRACGLPKLEAIGLQNNFQLEHIFGNQIQEEERVECPSLEWLGVVDCPLLSIQFVGTHLKAPSPKPLKDSCMDNIQGVEQQLQRRDHDLPQHTTMCFSTLKTVRLRDCKLKHVFTTSVVTGLHQLEELSLQSCNDLEEVISKVADGKDILAIGVSLENLKILEVSKCGKMKTIFPISIALPKLERFRLEGNPELEHIFGQSDWDCTWRYPFLEEFCLAGCPKICTQFAAWIQNLSTVTVMKHIELGYFQGVGELIQFQREDNKDNDLLTSPLETLSVRNIEEVKCIMCGPIQNICFSNLCQIKVIGCNKLKHIFMTAIARSLPKLMVLTVQRCNELEQVIMAEDEKEERENDANAELIRKVDFKNLEVLHVSDCEKLKTIFSMFIPLPKLHRLRLENNLELESLFRQSDYDCTSHGTCLGVLSVSGCPKLCTRLVDIVKDQLQVQPTTQLLEFINLSNIQGVQELVEFQRPRFLKLEEVGDLKRLWSGPRQNIDFSYLVGVRVIGCNKLKQLFTTTMATTLHHLKLLSVEKCLDLEQVIQEKGTEDSNIQADQQLAFHNLMILRLIDLPKLFSFCPTSCDLMLPHLTKKNLKVEGCSKPTTELFSEKSYKQVDENDYEFEYEYNDSVKDEYEDGDDDSEDDGYYNEKSINALFGVRQLFHRDHWDRKRFC